MILRTIMLMYILKNIRYMMMVGMLIKRTEYII